MITCRQILTDTDTLIYLIDIKREEMISIDILNKRSRYDLGPWSHYKQGFYILSNIHRKYTGLGFYNLKDFTIEWIVTPDCDVELNK